MLRYSARWIVFCVLGFVHLACFAQAGDAQKFKTVYGGHPHDFIYSIDIDGLNGVAVGDHGLILNTKDGGRTWVKNEKQVTKGALFSVVSVSGKCLAVGQSGEVIRSNDCQAWEKVEPILDARLLSVSMNSKGQALAVGGFGAILKSEDWGKTWSALSPAWKPMLQQDAEPHLYVANVSEDGSFTIAGEFELVIRSSDAGKNWKSLHKGARSLFGMQIAKNGHLYAVGQEGLILKSIDSGGVWTSIKSGTNALLNDVFVSSDGGTILIAGIRTLLVSKNNGASFTSDHSPKVKAGIFSVITGYSGANQKINVFIGGSGAEILEVVY